MADGTDSHLDATRACVAAAIIEAVPSLSDHPERGFMAPAPNLRQIAVPFGDSGDRVQYRVQTQAVIVAHVKRAQERR